MATKVDIWMPLYVADYLSATSRLTTEQHGAYFLLLMDYWKNGAPPDNNQILAQITKLSPDAWSNARSMLEPFFQVLDGLWIQQRVEAEMVKAKHNKSAAVARGKKGAQARWNSSSIDGAYLEQCLADGSSSSSSPSPSSISSPKPKRESSPKGSPPKPDDVSQQVWDDWKQLRKTKKAPVTETVIKGAMVEAGKAGVSLNEFLEIWCRRGSQGLEASWLDSKKTNDDDSRKKRDAEISERERHYAEEKASFSKPSPEIQERIKSLLNGRVTTNTPTHQK